jgi:nucleoside 2-deoxyribosyltransferase
MKTHSIYLAGPISGLSYGESENWRDYVKARLPENKEGLSPLRCKEYLCREGKIEDSYEEMILSSQRGIMTRDFFDSQRCDLMIVNLLGAEKPSLGTTMEIAWAFAFKKPLVVVMEPKGNVHDHAMIREAIGYRCTELDQAIDVVKAVLLP